MVPNSVDAFVSINQNLQKSEILHTVQMCSKLSLDLHYKTFVFETHKHEDP